MNSDLQPWQALPRALARGGRAAGLLSILAVAACATSGSDSGSPITEPPSTNEPTPGETPGLSPGQKAGAIGAGFVAPHPSTDEHCSADPLALEPPVVPLGASARIETETRCPLGVNEVLEYRFELTGPNGEIPMPGWTPAPTAVLDAAKLASEGEYEVTVFSRPRSMVGVVGDTPAIGSATHRSPPLKFSVAAAAWRESWSTCSASCEGGYETSSYTCGAAGTTCDPKWCPAPAPTVKQRVCNLDPCPVTGAIFTIGGLGPFFGGSGVAAVSEPGVPFWELFADTTIAGTTYFVAVFALELPTVETDLASTDTYPPLAGEAWVEAYIQDAQTTNDWWSSAKSPPVKFRFESDGKLHALVNDPALVANIGTGSPSVTADIPLP